MKSFLYKATLKINNCKGFAVVTAYDEKQVEEIVSEYWNGYQALGGNVGIQKLDIECECGVKTSLTVIAGNSLKDILNQQQEEEEKLFYQIGDFTFDVVRQTFSHKDGTVEGLTTKESEVLLKLLECPNKLVDRDEILEEIWGESNYYNSRSMDVYITKLRKHFSKDSRVELINVHGKGFKLVIPN